MKSKLLPIVILLTILLFSIPASLKGQNTKGNLIFQSGFEGTSQVVDRNGDADITGVDNSLPDHNDWVNDLDNNPNIGNFNLQYQGGDNSMRYAKIIPEPGNPSNHVLQFWLDSPNVEGKKGRIQANLYGNSGLFEFSQSVRVFLPDDFNKVKKFPPKISWLTIAEFWNNITWSQDVPYRFRITLGIGKNVEGEGDLSFILDAEDCQLFADGGQKYSTIWAEKNENIKVPVGKWFTLNLYFKEGDNTTGKFYLSMTPEGGTKQIVFDLTKITHNTEDPHPDGVGDFNPIKLYTSKGLIDFMKSQGRTLQIFWDDYKLWKGREPNL
jgi:hypothetical protein